jgi:hypothetical protein
MLAFEINAWTVCKIITSVNKRRKMEDKKGRDPRIVFKDPGPHLPVDEDRRRKTKARSNLSSEYVIQVILLIATIELYAQRRLRNRRRGS